MLPLRFPKVWAAAGWLLVAGVIVGSLIPGQALEGIHTSDKVLHAGAYFVLMVWFAGFYRRGAYPLIAVVLLALGAALELLQGLTQTRTTDWSDLVANGAGALAGLVLSASLLGGWCQRLEQRLLS